ncbi:MAG TPA: GNAT family N-acetyltransferase [Acidimicrobiales bacterium]|nr:GNAT family N-acetyltransferase [Acidimicrobiales bacterium]
MQGRLIGVRDISAGDEERWRDLAERAAEPNPLCEPDCVVPAAVHQTFGDEIALVVAEENGRFLACVPVRPVRRWYNIRYPVAANKVRRSTYVGTPLVDPVGATAAMATLLATLGDARRSLGCRLFGLDSLRQGGPVASYVHEAAVGLGLPVYEQENFERAFWVRRHEPTYLDDVRPSRRAHLRRRRRMLKDAFGYVPVLVDRSHDKAAVEEFVAMEAAGYKAVNGVALATVPGEVEYFTAMCERFAGAKRLVVLSLECGGETLGMQVSLRGGEGIFSVKVSYDERYRRFGPGVLLHTEMFEYVHHNTDARWVDSCSSENNGFLLELYPDRTRISTLLFPLGGKVDAAVVRGLTRVRPLHRRWRSLVDSASAGPGGR